MDLSILLGWQTYSELDILGFNLYRSTAMDGERTLVYQTPAVHRGKVQGDSYAYTDKEVMTDTAYTYWLDVVHNDGSIATLEPITTQLSQFTVKVYLPAIKN